MPEPEKPRRAAALRYREGDTAPEVVAAGRGLVADRILDAARAAGVPVAEDPALASALAALEVGTQIPTELYAAAAEALAWAYGLDAAAARS